jgi:hypothetical protein
MFQVAIFMAGDALPPESGQGHLPTGYSYLPTLMADPSPPSFSDEDMKLDPGAEIERLIERMRELLDQVYRRLVLYLCGPCYRQWIEDPAG